jgi:hypothetical protein
VKNSFYKKPNPTDIARQQVPIIFKKYKIFEPKMPKVPSTQQQAKGALASQNRA